ncbi:hypothetical protein HDU67_000033 [Dinochytrium kinnereticum]|nr:hypothetical protein HDU67_000033 [Dinochytrium kinnereticum]
MSTSQEAESIKIQAFLLFASYPHRVEEFHQHEASPSGELPFLMTPEGKILAGREIVDEVKEKVENTIIHNCLKKKYQAGCLSQHMSAEEQSDVIAFTALAETKLRLCLTYALWKEEANVTTVSFPIYELNFPWPLNQIIPRIKRFEALTWMSKRRANLSREEVYEDARSALAAFSAKLDGQLYLFGPKPTFADAILFAYLHVILSALNVTGAETRLREAVLKHENLVQYTRRIWSTWYINLNGVN